MIKQKYNKSPIQEAIFEARFALNNFDSTTTGQIYDAVKEYYPIKQDIKHHTIYLDDVNTASIPPAQLQAPRMQTRRVDNTELLQIGPGIVVANKLKYISWNDFTFAIKNVVQAYVDIVKPEYVTRIATRYINSFYIPEKNINVNDYFNLSIQVPNTIAHPQGFEVTILNNMMLHGVEFCIRTRFQSDSLREGETGNRFILDIDCFVTQNISPVIKDIIILATQAHDALEAVFESILTDRTRSLLEVVNV